MAQPKTQPHPDENPWDNWDGEGMTYTSQEKKLAQVKACQERAAAGKKAPKSGKCKTKKSDYNKARAVVEGFRGPISFCGANFRVFSEETGWEVCDKELRRACHEALGKNADKVLLPIIEAQTSIPSLEDSVDAPTYWERIGDAWESKWQPLRLSKDEILYTDRIVNVLTGEATDISGRTIYGPMISLPWGTTDEERDTASIERFMEERIPDVEIRRHFQEVAGTLLQPHAPLRGQIVLWGPPGSGKTTVARAISYAAAGAAGVSEQPESALAKSRWAANSLVNRFVNISDDSERVSQWVPFVKRYTSGCFVAEAKYGHPTMVAATAKLISTCNEFQDVADASGAMVDRLMPFRLEVRIEGDWDHEMMTAAWWSRMETRIRVVEWLAMGLARLRQRGKLNPPANWMTQKTVAVSEGDPIEGFLRANITQKEGCFLKTLDVLQRAQESSGFNRMDLDKLEKSLGVYLSRLFGATPTQRRVDGGRYRGYSGIELTE